MRSIKRNIEATRVAIMERKGDEWGDAEVFMIEGVGLSESQIIEKVHKVFPGKNMVVMSHSEIQETRVLSGSDFMKYSHVVNDKEETDHENN